MKPDGRVNPHGVPGHSHFVRDSPEPKECTGFGQHGGLGSNEQRPFLFASGGGFVPGVYHGPSSLVDIAPTVLQHLGLGMAGMDGRPLPRHPRLDRRGAICYAPLMPLTLYNTLTRRKEPFEPLDPRGSALCLRADRL